MKTYQQRQLLDLIQSSKGDSRSIQHISQYCIGRVKSAQDKLNEVEIAKFFQSIIRSNKMIETKLVVVKVMTQILASKHKNSFLKHFATRIVDAIALNKYSLISNPQSLRTLAALLQKWKNQKIFCQNFYTKIQQRMGAQLKDNIQLQLAQAKFIKYRKMVLLGYKDIDKNKNTVKIFKDCTKFYKLIKSVQQITQKHEKLTSENTLTNTEAKIMLQTSEILINQHVQALNLFQDSVQLIKNLFDQQVQNLNIPKEDLQKQETS